MIPPSWWAIIGLTASLGVSSYLLYDAIEDKGRLAVERDVARSALASTKLEMSKQSEIYEAGDRAVVALTEYRDVVVQPRTIVVVREIQAAPEAAVAARSAIRLGWQRMHELDDIERRATGAGAPSKPAADPAPTTAPSR
jgi:hypothetical protein